MDDITIRALQGEEIGEALHPLGMYAFHPSPPYRWSREDWLAMVRERKEITCRAAVDAAGAVLSIACSTPLTQNVRGALYPASGVWDVITAPAARRRGYCRQVMAELLAAERAAGKVFSNLYPFRESFYERMGYVTLPQTKTARFTTQALAPLLKLELEGAVEFKPLAEVYDLYREFLAELRLRTHGMAFFDCGNPASAVRSNLWAALARCEGRLEGFMLYRLQGGEVSHFDFSGLRFYYLTRRARALLLNWIARHVDQAEQVELLNLPPAELPETWLADLQVKFASPAHTAMTRVLDVARLGGMQVGEGGFTARIRDPFCPWNEGAWRFEAQGGRLAVAPATQAACELSIQALSALIAGAHDSADFELRAWGRPSPAEQSALRALFPPALPFLHENF